MTVNPHQIPHFARQMERIKQIREDWNGEPKEEGSYLSTRFAMWSLISELYLDILQKSVQADKDLLMNGI